MEYFFKILISCLILFTSCQNNLDKKNKQIKSSTIQVQTSKVNNDFLINNVNASDTIIDSIKMHAFDDIYFGQKSVINSKQIINNEEYIIPSTFYTKAGLYEFILYSEADFTNEYYSLKEINNLQKIISKKYKNKITVNKTLFYEPPEKYDEKNIFQIMEEPLIGKPYKHISYRWDLKYKIITLGYIINWTNDNFRYSEYVPKYKIQLRFKSKVIKADWAFDTISQIDESNKF